MDWATQCCCLNKEESERMGRTKSGDKGCYFLRVHPFFPKWGGAHILLKENLPLEGAEEDKKDKRMLRL